MTKVRIDVAGWEKFSDQLFMVPFENGVSTRDLTEKEIAIIGSNLKITRIGNDEQVGASVNMANTDHLSAQVTPPLKRGNETKVKEEKKEPKYTKEALIEIASEGGIKGIRKVADEFGVKGVQINSMIEDILLAQVEQE